MPRPHPLPIALTTSGPLLLARLAPLALADQALRVAGMTEAAGPRH